MSKTVKLGQQMIDKQRNGSQLGIIVPTPVIHADYESELFHVVVPPESVDTVIDLHKDTAHRPKRTKRHCETDDCHKQIVNNPHFNRHQQHIVSEYEEEYLCVRTEKMVDKNTALNK